MVFQLNILVFCVIKSWDEGFQLYLVGDIYIKYVKKGTKVKNNQTVWKTESERSEIYLKNISNDSEYTNPI